MSRTTTDPIADMLSRIRNAIMVDKNSVVLPHSKIKETVAKQLADVNFLESVEVQEENARKQLMITIHQPGQPARITKIERISKPGRRAYAKAAQIPKIKNGRGVVIVSTSHGIMTGRQAIKKRLGGELICKVY